MKNFTNNFKQFTSRLSARWLIMALMLLLGTSSAWAANIDGTIYFEKPSTWTNGDVYFCIGKSNWSDFNNKMTHVCGNYYKIVITWDGAEHIGFTNCDDVSGWNDNDENFTIRYNYLKNTFCSGKTAPSTNSIATNKIYYIDASGNIKSKNQTLDPTCCTAPTSEPLLSKVSDIVKCGTTTTTSGTLKITTVNDGSTYYYKNGTNGSDVQINFGNNNQFTVSSIGDYYVKEVNDCGASSSWSSKVTISETNNSVSISDITGPDNICSRSSAGYSITAIDGVTYNWSINSDKFTLGDNGTNSIQVTATGTADATATLTVTATKSGCPTTQTKSINLIALPTITTVSPTEGTVCSSTTISALEGTLSIDKSANSTTKWYKDGEEKSPTTTVETGKYTIKAVSNTASCLSSSGVTYNVTGITTIPTNLVIDINGSTSATICGGTATINAKASGATSYSLYKGNGDLVETKDGNANGVSFTVSDANTYKVKATNNCGSTGYSSDVTLTVIDVPSKPSFVTDGEVTCAEKPVNPNLSKELASGEYLVWYDASEGGTNLGSNLTSSAEDETKIYYAAVSNGACESAERTPYTVDVEADPIEDLTLTLVDGYGNSLPLYYTYCQGDDVNVKLTYNGGIYWGEPEWNSTLTAGDMNTSGLRYDAVNKKGEGTYTISNLQASGTLQVALTMCGDTKATSNVLNVNITPQAETPTVEVLLNIEKCGNDITQYGKIQISPYNAGYTYKINDTDVTPNNNGIVENLSTAGSFTLSAINSCKVSTPSAPFTIRETDNKPTISISGSEQAVPYEDVMLTATATAGATIKWYEGGVEKATGATYVVTSETATSKDVTAKAFLGGCESGVATKTVTFSAETCKPTTITVPANYIEIYCKYNDAPTQHDMKVDIWKQSEGQGTESYQSCSKSVDGYAYWKFNITDDATYCIRISNKELIYKSGSMCTLTRGHKYYFDIPGGWSGWTKGPDKSKTQDITETQDGPPAITTPAVKTVSATSEEGSGTVTFTGQIIKTGCAATSKIYYGYQFKKADEEWPTTDVEASNTPVEGKLIPLTNASETALYYQFSANVENLEDVDYHFRAYIINGYDFTNGNYDQGVYYGLDKLVTVSTVQTAVKTAEIELVNQDGTSVEPGHKYCVGETGYIKVTSDVKYTTATWKSDLGVEIEQIGKTNIYQFEVKGKDQIVVLLSNKHNTEPVSSNPREVDVYASPSVPEIALGESSICDTNEDGTTLTVTRTKAGQYYALYKEDGNGGIKVEDYQLCSSDNAAIEYTGLKESAKYFVKTYRGECDSEITRSSSATLTVVDSKDVKISIEPTDTETTPWMPAKLTVTATSDYTVTSVPNDAVINISGNIVKVKLPLPTEGVQNKSTTKDNVNVTFDNITYTITAELRTAGEEGNPCAQPAIANITLTPYIEICD